MNNLNQPSDNKMQYYYLRKEDYLGEVAIQFFHLLLQLKRNEARDLIMEEIKKGRTVKDIYLNVFQKTQYEVGYQWHVKMLSVAQEHFCTAAVQWIMSQLYPYIIKGKNQGGKFLGTCVGGELHEIGIRIITDLIQMDGWDTWFLGSNSDPREVVKTVENNKIDVIGISATMTFNMKNALEIITMLRSNDGTKDVKIMVGGLAFKAHTELWENCGADAYSDSAEDAVGTAKRLLEECKHGQAVK